MRKNIYQPFLYQIFGLLWKKLYTPFSSGIQPKYPRTLSYSLLAMFFNNGQFNTQTIVINK